MTNLGKPETSLPTLVVDAYRHWQLERRADNLGRLAVNLPVGSAFYRGSFSVCVLPSTEPREFSSLCLEEQVSTYDDVLVSNIRMFSGRMSCVETIQIDQSFLSFYGGQNQISKHFNSHAPKKGDLTLYDVNWLLRTTQRIITKGVQFSATS